MSNIPILSAFLFLLAGSLGLSSTALAQATIRSNANGNWNAAGTWTIISGSDADGIPDADDAVQMAAGFTVTITADAACASLTFLAPGGSANLTHNAGVSLTVGGGVTINSSSDTGPSTKAWNINAGNAIVNGNVTLAQGSAFNNRVARINITTGSLDINGDLIYTVGNANRAVIDMTGGAGTLNLSGNFTLSSGVGRLNPGATSTFIYDGTGAQTVAGGSLISYRNLTVNKSAGIASIGAVGISVSGTTNITGQLDITSTTGAKTFGSIIVNSGGTWNVTVNEGFTINGDIQNDGTFNAGPGGGPNTYTLAGSGRTISGTNPVPIPRATINGTYTNLGTFTVATALSGTGALTNATNTTLNIGGTSGITTLTATANPNTVNYDGAGVQTIKAATYHHLTLSGGGTKTAGGPLVVQGNLSISGVSLADAANVVTVNGDISNAGSHTGTGRIFLTGGSAAHSLSGTGSYTNVELNEANGATLSANPTINGTLTLTNGLITTGVNTLIISSTGTVSRTSGHIVGNLQKNVATGPTARTFEIGDAGTYTPVAVSFGNVSTAGNLTATTTLGDHPDISNSGVGAVNSVNRYWTLTNSGIVFDNYSATFNFVAGDVDAGANTNDFIVAKKDGAVWSVPTVGTRTATSTQATGMTSFSDFQVGEPRATQLAITLVNGGVNPIAETAFSVVVESQDGSGIARRLSANTGISLTLNTGSGTLGGTLTGTILTGSSTVTISGLTYTKAESGVSLTASRTSGEMLTSGNSALFTVDPGSATSLRVTGAGTMTAGGSNELTITAYDANGNVVSSGPNNYTGAKILTFSGPGVSPDGNTPTVEAVNVGTSQLVTFTNGVSNPNAATLVAYLVETTTVDVTNGTINSFADPSYDLDLTVSVAGADHLILAAPGSTPMAGSSFNFASLTSHDQFGNIATGYTGAHTISYTQSGTPNAPEGGATDTYTTSVSFTAGVATSTLATTLYRAQTSITVTADAGDDGGVAANHPTAGFNVDPVAPASLRVTGAGAMTAGTSNELSVTAKDAFGNTVSFGPNNYTGSKTLTFSGPGNAPAGNIPTVEGVNVGTAQAVTFTNGVSNANAATLVAYNAETVSVDVTDGTISSSGNAAHDLDLTVNPATVDEFVIGTVSSPQTAGAALNIDITARDLYDNTATGFVGTVGMSTTAGTISPTTSGAFAGGLRTQSVTVTQAGTGKTITVNDGAGHVGSSNVFDVNPGPLDHFAIGAISSPQVAGVSIGILITAQDADNNTVTGFAGTVGLTTTAGSISPSVSGSFVLGVRIESVTVTQAGAGKTITPDDGAGHTGVSNAFAVNPMTATVLAFTTQPGSATAGSVFGQQPVVVSRDAFGNNSTVGLAASLNVTVALTAGTGPLQGTTTLDIGTAAGNGTVSFTNLRIDIAGTDKQLTASATGLTDGVSSVFTVNPAALDHFAIATISSPKTAGTAFNIDNTAQDAFNNTVTSFAGTVNLSTTAGTISPTTSGAFAGGLRTQSVTVTQAGVGKTITVDDGAGHTGVSNAFSVVAGAPTQVVFTTQPGNGTGGTPLSTQPVVEIRDADGNTATSSSSNVATAIGTNPSSGTLSGTTTVAAVNGVVTFTNLSINRAGIGYMLVASSTGLTSATSAGFNIILGPAAVISLTSGNDQSGQVDAPLGSAFIVTVTDAGGNPVSGTSVAFAIASTPAGASGQSLTVTNAITGVSGQASTLLTLGSRTGTYLVTATSAGLSGSPVTFSAVATAGAPTTIALTSGDGQSAAIMSTLSAPLVVTVTDAGGNPVSDAAVTFGIAGSPAGATGQSISVTVTTTNASGEASTDFTLGNKVGTYTVQSISIGLTGSPVTFTATATVGSPTQLAFVTQPGNGTGGSPLTTQPRVEIRDAGDNAVTNSTASVTISIGSNPGSGTLSGTMTVAAVNGIATFTDLIIDKVGYGYTLVASSSGLSSAASSPFDVNVGPAATISQSSGNNQNGQISSSLSSPLVVVVTDAGGNAVSGVSVNFAITNVPSGATGQSLNVTSATTNALGLASSVLTLGNRVGTYTVTASSGSLLGSPVMFVANATFGPPVALVFLTQPGDGTGGSPFSTQPRVEVQDAGGNTVTTSSAVVSVAIGTNPGGGVLGGTTTIAAVNGVATFADLSIDKVGSGYTLVASSAGLLSVTSNPFAITVGPAAAIVLTSGNNQSATILTTLSDPFVVTVTDVGGNAVPGVAVAFSIQSTPAAAAGQSLSVTNATTDGNGRAPSLLTLGDKVGDYTALASSAGLTGSPISFTSSATVGVPTTISLLSGSGQSGRVNTALTNPFAVLVTDGGGNPVAGVRVDFEIISVPSGATGQQLSAAQVTTDVAGEASAILTLGNKVGAYLITASSVGLSGSPVSFNAFAVQGAAAALALKSGNNQTGVISTSLADPLVVEVTDADGNVVPGVVVTFDIVGVPSGAIGQSLSTSSAVTDVLGEASTVLTLGSRVGEYVVAATSTGLSGSPVSFTSSATPGASLSLAFLTQPGVGEGGTPLRVQPVVEVRDAGGNRVISSSAAVSVAIDSNPVGGTLSGTTTVAAVGGVATFTDLTLDKAGIGYTLVATSAGLIQVLSEPFTVAVGPETQLAFVVQPGDALGGDRLSTQPQVAVQDAGGNTVLTSSVLVSVSIGNNPGGGSLSGTMSVTSVNGIVSFADLIIDKAGIGYTLVASASNLISSVSASFDVAVGPPSKLEYVAQPGNGTGGTPLNPQPRVAVEDAGGNVVTTSDAVVTVALGNNPVGGTVSGTTSVTAVNGVANFADLTIDKAGSGYTLIALSTQLVAVTSIPFDITVGSPTALTKTSGNDQRGMAGTPLQNPFVVTVQDAGGNPVPGVNIHFEITSAPAGATGQELTMINATTDALGQALSVLTFGSRAGIYTVTASSAGLSGSPVTFIATAREADGTGVATIDPALVLVSVQTSESITVVGDGRATISSVSVVIPANWAWSGNLADVTLGGDGFAAASGSISGDGSTSSPYVITVSNALVTTVDVGSVTVSKLVPPSTAGQYSFIVSTAALDGTLVPIGNSPPVEVHELVIGDSNLDSEVNILDVILTIDFILERTPMSQVQQVITDVYPAHASPELQGPPDGVVDISDMILMQNAILNGIWDDGTVLGVGNGSTSPATSEVSSAALIGSAVEADPPQTSSGEVLVTFEVYEDKMLVRMTNPMPVRGFQLSLRLTVPVTQPFETEKFQRVDFMNAPSKVVGLRHTILLYNPQNKPIDPGDQYILFIKGDWSAYDIPGTEIIIGDEENSRTTTVHRWVRGENLPTKFKLEQNYPNPFNPSTTIQFELPEFAKVKVAIFDMLGRHIKTLVNGEMDPGVHSLQWDGTDDSGQRVASGMYLYRMRAHQTDGGQAGDFIRSKKMMLVK